MNRQKHQPARFKATPNKIMQHWKTAQFGAFLFSLLVSTITCAQEISIGGEYRVNPVYSRGFREPLYQGDRPSLFTMQRTRLIFKYQKPDDLETELIVQDRRFWGEEDDRADMPSITVFRAWAEKYFTPELSLKIGRQGLVYDDQQILSDPNWVGTRAHDVALLKYQTNDLKLHLAAAHGTNGQDLKWEPYLPDMYRNMAFIWAEKSLGDHSLSMIFLNRGMQRADSSVAYTQTFGPFANIRLNSNLSFKGLYYYQMGMNTAGQEVSAYLFSTQLIYKRSNRLLVTVGLDASSGTNQTQLDDPANRKSHTFDRMYGLHHGKFGYLDYFYVNNPTLCGVYDYYLKARVTLTDSFTIENHLHNFASSATLNSVADGSVLDKQLGVENDLLLSYRFSPTFKVTLAHSIMFGTPTLDHFFGGQESEENQVFYAVITATPSFFSTKNE